MKKEEQLVPSPKKSKSRCKKRKIETDFMSSSQPNFDLNISAAEQLYYSRQSSTYNLVKSSGKPLTISARGSNRVTTTSSTTGNLTNIVTSRISLQNTWSKTELSDHNIPMGDLRSSIPTIKKTKVKNLGRNVQSVSKSIKTIRY